MTQRPRPVTRPRGRGLRNSLQGEERQQFLVTALFAGLIVLLIVLLLGAVALAWYNDNLRPVARVGAVDILPATVRERVALLVNRLDRREGELRVALTDGDITSEVWDQRLTALNEERQQLSIASIEGLIDVIYQSQLAAERGIVVSAADVDQRLAEEVSGSERRRVLAVFVEPQADDDESSPTLAQRKTALERAQTALEQIRSGRPWADVAREFSTDPSKDAGGEYGTISRSTSVDARWSEALFGLAQGETTEVVRGTDGIYRIGQVVEIVPRQEQPGEREKLFRRVPEQRYREFAAYEIAADRLKAEIVAETVAATPEQVRLGDIFIEGMFTGDEVEEGEVAYSEIVYAPGDDLEDAPNLDAADPAWEQARTEAEAAATELRAITDPAILGERFAEIAADVSDSPSAAEDGEVEFTTRGLLPAAIGDALFEGEHQQNEIIGPIRADAGYWVIRFEERRDAPEVRVQNAVDAAKAPGADFAAVARELSDGQDAEDGGELGWVTPEQLPPAFVDQVFALQPGEVSEPIEGQGFINRGEEPVEGHYIFKVYERATRPLDPDQIADIRDNSFELWYSPKKDEAEEAGVITRTDEEDTTLDPGLDQPLQ